MGTKGNYQFIVLPPYPKEYMTLDYEPQRKSEAGIVYTIPKGIFAGDDIKFRIRKKARDFTTIWWEGGKIFAVICKSDKGRECLYFGKLVLYDRNYPEPHVQPSLYLSRCVGSRGSKMHFDKVSEYVLEHYKEILNLELGEVFEANI